MSPLLRQFELQWAPYRSEPRVLIACSGGPDSVALLRLLQQTHPEPHGLTVAHFNHQLRGRESELDAQFVGELCGHLRLPLEIGRAEPDVLQATSRGEGLESAARQLRYAYLTRTAERLGARYVVTGHTADDQVETVLHHLLRGSGLSGLAGIPVHRLLSPAVTVVRPLLSLTRSQILEYLQDQRQAYRLDDHNQQRQFLRNRIRHELLPLLERDYQPSVRDSLLNLAQIAADAQALIQDLAKSLLDRCLLASGSEEWQLDCRPLQSAPEHLCREVFVCLWRERDWPQQAMSFERWRQLAVLSRAAANGTTLSFPGAIRAERTESRLILRRCARKE